MPDSVPVHPTPGFEDTGGLEEQEGSSRHGLNPSHSSTAPSDFHFAQFAQRKTYTRSTGGRTGGRLSEVQRALDGILGCSAFARCGDKGDGASPASLGNAKPFVENLPSAVSVPELSSLLASPAQGFHIASALGASKARMPALKCLALSIVSGAHIGFGAFLAISCGGNMPGIKETDPGLQSLLLGVFGFPLGLFITVISGAELFTGNAATVPLSSVASSSHFLRVFSASPP